MATPRTPGAGGAKAPAPSGSGSRSKLIIVGLIAVAVVAVLAFTLGGSGGGDLPASGNITNEQAQDLIAKGAVLLDVRTAAEFAGGVIEGAINIPVNELAGQLGTLDTSEPVIVYCAVGDRSVPAMQMLQSAGFEHVYNLAQGIAGWAQAGLEVASPTQTAANGGGAPTPSASGLPVMYEFYTDW